MTSNSQTSRAPEICGTTLPATMPASLSQVRRWLCAIAVTSLALTASQAFAQTFPPVFELSSLAVGDSSTGFVLNGVAAGDGSGQAVSMVGDLNGDGIDDLMIGAWRADPGGLIEAGETYVVFGRDSTTGGFPAEFELSALAAGDGSLGFVLYGVDSNDASGGSVAAGDVNGDGIDDLIIGAPAAGPEAGETYVVYGRESTGGGFSPQIDLASLAAGDGSSGFVLRGVAVSDFSGTTVHADDVNGDGIDDLMIGAINADPLGVINAGEVYVVFGRDGSAGAFPAVFELSSLIAGNGGEGFVLGGGDDGDDVGTSVSTGDVDGDGIQDLIIGSPRVDLEAPISGDPGATYVVFGRTAADGGFPPRIVLPLLAAGDGGDGFVLTGTGYNDRSGGAVSAGDINGDGIDDIIVGADYATASITQEGRTYVVYGRRGSAGGFPALLPLSSLPNGDGSMGFVLNGEERGDNSGNQVTAADIDGDGIEDVIIGAALANPGGTNKGRNDAGKTYVVFGRDTAVGSFPAEFELSSLATGDGSTGFVLYGAVKQDAVNRNSYSGIALSSGDLNGDGIADLAMGAAGADPGGRSEAGAAYVVFGRATGSPTAPVLSIENSPAAVEGDFLQFKVKLSQPVFENVSFDVRTIDGTATATEDYQEKGGSRLFAPGETERTLWVQTVDDETIEPNETLRLRLSKPENAELGKASAKGIIVDNDDPSDWARLTVANARAAEGGRAVFELTLSKPTKKDVKIAVQTIDVTASANLDYAPKGGIRIIPAGETRHKIFVEIAADDVVEGVEKFRLRVDVRSNNAVVVHGNATGTITGP